LSRVKSLDAWSESPWNQSGRKGIGLWRKEFAEEPSCTDSER